MRVLQLWMRSHVPPVSIRSETLSSVVNPGNLGRLQMETLESGFVENKGVPVCKRIGTLQFPIGDDVSYFHPLRSSVPFVFSYTDAHETDRRSSLRYCAGVD